MLLEVGPFVKHPAKGTATRVQEQVCSELQNGRKNVAEFAENSGNRRSVSAAPPEFCANSATDAFLRPRYSRLGDVRYWKTTR